MKNKQLIPGIVSILSLLLCGCNTTTNSDIPTPTPSDDKEPEGEPEETITREERLGMTPVFSKDKKSVTYGLYPKSYVIDVETIRALQGLTKKESNGFYLYNDNYYVSKKAVGRPNAYFDNNDIIENGKLYWFKCEPIEWQVLSYKSGRYLLLSKYLLAPITYYSPIDPPENPNNYKGSHARSYLNNQFYNTCFSLNNIHIVTTSVDNSASTTNTYSNPYACEDTSDKVFLLSYQDYLNTEYGFTDNIYRTDTRCCKTTDYARTFGNDFETNRGEKYGNSTYWTRSPGDYSNQLAFRISTDGYLSCEQSVTQSFYLRPSINIIV